MSPHSSELWQRGENPPDEGQRGGALLALVAVLGIIMVLVQGTLYQRAKDSAKFIGTEKVKVLAQQMAEAGVEENIADIGSRKLRVAPSMSRFVTYDHKTLGGGWYSSHLTMVASGSTGDTVDLSSTGTVGKGSHTIQARLLLKHYLDTLRTLTLSAKPETTLTFASRLVPETTTTVTVLDPRTVPAISATPEYVAFRSSSARKADICHLPGGDWTKANVINVSKNAVDTHFGHHGDYLAVDGTCDRYLPDTTRTVRNRTVQDTTRIVSGSNAYDTTLVVDTIIKTQFLSWK